MIGVLAVLALLAFLFWLAFHITGTLLSASIWFFVKLPLAIVVASIGLAFCMTILLIPVGGKCFQFAGSLLFG